MSLSGNQLTGNNAAIFGVGRKITPVSSAFTVIVIQRESATLILLEHAAGKSLLENSQAKVLLQ